MKKNYEVRIVEKRCKMCGICVDFCPREVLSIKINSIPEVINTDRCTGCKLCYQRCPEIAIFVDEKEV